MVTEKTIEYNTSLVLFIVDFQKVFDTVKIDAIILKPGNTISLKFFIAILEYA